MNKKTETEKTEAKQPYISPRLQSYGALRDLTTSGSQPGTEDPGGAPGEMLKIMLMG